ncbi:MAG TPA: VOC family protein [Solirubrobacteraceae bacterium]|jgi:catechol 2,3-dioxygenase|nr:VOC family protein [Solirubrobacteraceae bacterium]
MSPIDPALKIAKVRLDVADLGRSTDFYERVMGLETIERDSERTLLGADPQAPALELTALDRAASAPRGSTGLFHVAWLHTSRPALAETVRRIAGAGWRFEGASDHGVSEALYLSDPDGLGIEIYVDRPRESWRRAPGGGVEMVTLPLDLEDLLASFPDDPGERMLPGTGIGHVHLKVADVAATERFYTGLGFEQQARLPSAAFVSAGGYHHHLGLNTWQSAGGSPAPEGSPALRQIAFALDDEAALDALAETAQVSDGRNGGGDLSLLDPDGIPLSFTAGG